MTTSENYSYHFWSPKPAREIFECLLDIPQWWSGLYNEHIEGTCRHVGDVFTFNAGDGMHYSKQKLTELLPHSSIAWEVTDSRLSFLAEPEEWTGSTIRFTLTPEKDGTAVVFCHERLVPQMACYQQCTGAWTAYLDQLKAKLEK